jgi:MerR family transcriptional regulator, light-induced transcriptional regulator
MADLRIPVMADISYDRGGRQPGRGNDFARRIAIARSQKFERQKAALQRAVEFEVVPRLLSAHKPIADLGRSEQTGPDANIKIFAGIVLGRNADAASLHVQGLLEQGTALEELYLKLLAPTASYLKQLWIDDERDFAQVTLGLWRLQQLLREFSSAFRQTAKKPTGHRVLLTLAPDETHELPYLLFTLVLNGEFLRREGWSSWIEPDCARADTLALVRNEWFDVIEILVNGERRLDRLAAQIKTIRGESINRSVCIAVAGNTVHQRPELVKYLGADVLAAGLEKAGAAYTISNR